MFEVMVESLFSAANKLDHYTFEGRCDELHGHNFVVQVFAAAPTLNAANVSVDRHQLKLALEVLVHRLDHTSLTTFPDFEGNPTSVENTTRYFFRHLKTQFPQVSRVVIQETPSQSACYFEAS
ncbi:MAG: 6-pyruvoyl tetrahydropterin synthase family protein [Candidatus Melainabacteria bacterium]